MGCCDILRIFFSSRDGIFEILPPAARAGFWTVKFDRVSESKTTKENEMVLFPV